MIPFEHHGGNRHYLRRLPGLGGHFRPDSGGLPRQRYRAGAAGFATDPFNRGYNAKILKPEHIQRFSAFLVANMSFFFLPSCVGVMEHAPAILRQLAPFLLISFLTTPLVYLATAWAVQWMIRRARRKEGRSRD